MFFALLDPTISTVIPSYATSGSAGLDVQATSHRFVPRTYDETKKRYVGGYHEYGTNLAVQIPEGHVGLLFAKSSSRDYTQRLANAVGVIDSDYRGELRFSYKADDEGARHYRTEYQKGDVVGQLVIFTLPRFEPELVHYSDLSQTERGEGGHGSTEQPRYETATGESVDQTVAAQLVAESDEATSTSKSEKPLSSADTAHEQPFTKLQEHNADTAEAAAETDKSADDE